MSLICPYSKLGCLSAILTKWDANPKINVLLGLLGIIIRKTGYLLPNLCSGIGFLTPLQDNCWLMNDKYFKFKTSLSSLSIGIPFVTNQYFMK